MGMTPEDYLQSFVQGNLADCEADPSSVRLAFNAAVSASHLADHYYHYHDRRNPHKVAEFSDLTSFLSQSERETDGGLRDIRSISNAYKHLYLTRGEPEIDSAGRVESITFKESESRGLTNMGWNLESTEELRVVYTRKDGSTHDFLETLQKVVAYWEDVVWRQ